MLLLPVNLWDNFPSLLVLPCCQSVFKWIFQLYLWLWKNFKPTREQFLFGYLDESFNTPSNYLVLWLKKFIWSKKFKTEVNLSVAGFKNYLLYALKDLKKIYDIKNNPAKFYEWNDLFILLEPDNHEDPRHGLQVQQVHDLLIQAADQQGPHLPPP